MKLPQFDFMNLWQGRAKRVSRVSEIRGVSFQPIFAEIMSMEFWKQISIKTYFDSKLAQSTFLSMFKHKLAGNSKIDTMPQIF